jgi:PII-like signaling protein
MDQKKDIRLLRIFMSNTDKFKNKPLYEVIVYAAQRYGIAGATVLKGIMSYGESSRINSLKFWEISEKLPVVIEIIDEVNKVENFFESIKPYFDKINKGIIVTIEKVNVVLYKTGKKK